MTVTGLPPAGLRNRATLDHPRTAPPAGSGPQPCDFLPIR